LKFGGINGDCPMKETVGSLKAYFIVVAVFGLIGSIGTITASQINPLFLIVGLIGFAFSLAYLYMGVMLRKLLVESPGIIKNVILVSMIYQLINFLLSLLAGFQIVSIINLAIGLLITWYLLNSAERLSQEEKSKLRSQ
jgi:hypothetical protein